MKTKTPLTLKLFTRTLSLMQQQDYLPYKFVLNNYQNFLRFATAMAVPRPFLTHETSLGIASIEGEHNL
jgi:hypothetical protein